MLAALLLLADLSPQPTNIMDKANVVGRNTEFIMKVDLRTIKSFWAMVNRSENKQASAII